MSLLIHLFGEFLRDFRRWLHFSFNIFGLSAFDMRERRGYLRPLVAAVVIGSPVAYLLMTMWLRNFAYKIEIGLGLMSLAWLGLTLIFLFTVSYHTIKSAIANPVKILRD